MVIGDLDVEVKPDQPVSFAAAWNRRGDPVAVVARDGTVVETARFDVHGEASYRTELLGQCTTAELGTACRSRYGNSRGMSGARALLAPDWYDMRARPYSARLRTFGAPDPLGTVDAFDLHLYVGGDPLNAVDPFGLELVDVDPNPADDPTTRDRRRRTACIACAPAFPPHAPYGTVLVNDEHGRGVVIEVEREEEFVCRRNFVAAVENLPNRGLLGAAMALVSCGAGRSWERCQGRVRFANAADDLVLNAAEGVAATGRLAPSRPVLDVSPEQPRLGTAASPPPSRGSSARAPRSAPPRTLREQLAVAQAMSDPSMGRELPLSLGDPRWPASEGWVKMELRVGHDSGAGVINVHYLMNRETGATDDFKIIAE